MIISEQHNSEIFGLHKTKIIKRVEALTHRPLHAVAQNCKQQQQIVATIIRYVDHVLSVQTVFKRMQILRAAPLAPGLGFWLAKQQRRWRRQELAPEAARLLRLAGVSLGSSSLEQWRQQAHTAAAYLLGSTLGDVSSSLALHPL